MSANENGDDKKACCAAGQEKLHILALHGYRQNGHVFRQKTGSLRKMVHKFARFTYITAPHKVIPVDDLSKAEDVDVGQAPDLEQYGWFFNRDDKTYRGIRRGGPAIGFEESVKLVEDAFEQYGPFDGIMGFSQGACFVGLLCDLQERGLTKIKFNFAIMASGFKSNCLPHMKYYSEAINLPSLHIFGENDDIIPTEMSRELRNSFDANTVTVVHPGGHYFPATSHQKQFYLKFFKTMYIQKLKKQQHEED